ncbi:hypothetical protein [Isoptericola croceus]|nr:hypothetical protein [Isoptericola croceus]
MASFVRTALVAVSTPRRTEDARIDTPTGVVDEIVQPSAQPTR